MRSSIDSSYKILDLELTVTEDLLATDRPPWIQDSLGDEKQDRVARKIRKGIFLSNFTEFENFIKSSSEAVLQEVLATQTKKGGLKGVQRDEAAKILINSIEHIPSWRSADERQILAYDIAHSLISGLDRGSFNIPITSFYTGSNVTFSNVTAFASSIWKIRDGKKAPSGYKFLEINNEIFRNLSDVRGSFKNAFEEISTIRNKVAHEHSFSLPESDLLTHTRTVRALATCFMVWTNLELQITKNASISRPASVPFEIMGQRLVAVLDPSNRPPLAVENASQPADL